MSALDKARDIGFWLAAGFVGRRLYASDSAAVKPKLERLLVALAEYYAEPGTELFSIGAMARGVSLGGVPLLAPAEGLSKLANHMRLRGFGVLSIARAASLAELETLLALLNLEPAEVTAIDVTQWLKDRGAQNVDVKHLEISEGKVTRSMRELYSNGEDTLKRQLKRVGDKGAIEMKAVSELAGTMLDLVVNSTVPVATMVALRGRDDFSFVHSMNVSVLAGAQASSLGLDDDLVRQISIAGLLHDIGKSTVPDAVLHKKTALTAAEQKTLHDHASEGARILLRSHGSGGLEAIVAAEHHLPFTDDPHLASQIVAVADVFDSIRTLRPFANRESLRDVLTYMLDKMGARLNPYLVHRFCAMCGMYVPGDVVHLNSGEVARVVSTHVEFGSKPVLEVVDAARGRSRPGTLVDLSQAKTQTTVQLTTETTMKGLTLEAIEAIG